MLNQVLLVGKIYLKPVYDERWNLTEHPYKLFIEADNEIFSVYIWKGLADVIDEKYDVGTMVGIKGSLTTWNGNIYVIGEKVSFITEKED